MMENEEKKYFLGENDRHVQSRTYSSGEVSIDFYSKVYNIKPVTYVQEFLKVRKTTLEQLSKFSFTSFFNENNDKKEIDWHDLEKKNAYYFTKCGHCNYAILTNREEGFKIDCQNCQERSKCKKMYLEYENEDDDHEDDESDILSMSFEKKYYEITKIVNEKVSKRIDFFIEEGIKKCVENKKCTFDFTKEEFSFQRTFDCITCKLMDDSGICESCVQICHLDHEVKEKSDSPNMFFCDCGSGEGISKNEKEEELKEEKE